MKAHQNEYKVINMCQVFKVSKSGYYKYKGRTTNQAKQELANSIKACFIRHKSRSGARKIHIDIAKTYNVSSATVGRYMHKLGLKAKNRSKFRYTKSKTNAYIADNLLNRDFTAKKANSKWVSDITYIKVDYKWHYLCVIIDLYSRKVIAWKLSHNMQAGLVTDTLDIALNNRNIKSKPNDLMFHSDRGSQYTSLEVKTKLNQENIVSSMSRKGNCWDNAVAESFFKSLKSELHTQPHWSFEHMQLQLFEYIDIDYNSKRYHSYLNYRTPNNFELFGL
ncbi:MAG: hypothetical protein RLZZ210_1773 [Pseudomonadota bacterium]|jgi:transposase InsO family protein